MRLCAKLRCVLPPVRFVKVLSGFRMDFRPENEQTSPMTILPPPLTAFFSTWKAFSGSLMIDKPSVHIQGGNVAFDQFDVRPTIVRNLSASLL
jgi:hypothetical protein